MIHKVTRALGDALFWCAGANPELAGQDRLHRLERAKYVSVGLSVVLTALAGGASMFMVLQLITNMFAAWHVPVAVFWALFVFNLDRWLVSGAAYGEAGADGELHAPSRKTPWAGLVGRLVLAGLLAATISEPVMLTIFSKEIERQIASTKTVLRGQSADEVRNSPEFAGRLGDKGNPASTPNTIEGRWHAARQRVIDARTVFGEAQKAYDDEVNGTGGTLIRGCDTQRGSACVLRLGAVKSAESALASALEQERLAQQTYVEESRTWQSDLEVAIAARQAKDSQVDGLMAKEVALDQLIGDNFTLWIRQWLIRAIFFLVDLLPVLLKVFAPTSMHDLAVHREAARQLRQQRFEDKTGALIVEKHHEVRRASVLMAEEVRLARADSQRVVGLEEIKLDTEFALRNLHFRQQERLGEAAMALQGTEVIPVTRDPRAADVTDPDHSETMPVPERAAQPQSDSGNRPVLNGRWVVLGRLPGADEGGFSETLLAHDQEQPGRQVVIKRVRLAGGSHRTKLQALAKEQNLQSRIRSRYVAPILDTGDDLTFGPFIVTPRYPHTLSARMDERDRPLTLGLSMRIIEQVLQGLVDSWDAAGLVHLDIKPANIALDTGQVRLIDFGLAKIVSGMADGFTTDADPKFTRWYAPLEQIRRDPPDSWCSSACDVRAVGATWYEMLTGHRPLFLEAEERGLLDANKRIDPRYHAEFEKLLANCVPRPPSLLTPGLPKAVDDLVLQWLSAAPIDRVPTRPQPDQCHAQLALSALEEVAHEVELFGSDVQYMPVGGDDAAWSDIEPSAETRHGKSERGPR